MLEGFGFRFEDQGLRVYSAQFAGTEQLLTYYPSNHGRTVETQATLRFASQLPRRATSEVYQLQDKAHTEQMITVYPSCGTQGVREPGARPGVRKIQGVYRV